MQQTLHFIRSTCQYRYNNHESMATPDASLRILTIRSLGISPTSEPATDELTRDGPSNSTRAMPMILLTQQDNQLDPYRIATCEEEEVMDRFLQLFWRMQRWV